MKYFAASVAIGIMFWFVLWVAISDNGAKENSPSNRVTVTTNNSAIEGKSFLEVIKYEIDNDEFKNCKSSGLRNLDAIQSIDIETKNDIDVIISKMDAPAIFDYGLNYAEDLDIDISARARDQIVMYIFNRAAEKGSSRAMNEIGASLLYCYLHVEQNVPQAVDWLKKAVALDDEYAMLSLGKIYLQGIGGFGDMAEGKALIMSCASQGLEDCIQLAANF